ncbi:MAG: HAMP domain-containing histidine kinase [Candidatus Lokiarchaeota archaeon]|nr:HAMP domain-containing histidine kinase [Candidatus Lokiarchaeota archaeon]
MILSCLLCLLLVFVPIGVSINFFYSVLIENALRSIAMLSIGFVVSFLSNRLSREEEVHRAYDELFFFRALLIHDMNNILQGIRSASELYFLYKDDSKIEGNIDELLEIIFNQCNKGFELISNVRKLSDLEIQKQKLETVEVKTCIQDAIKFVKNNYISRNLEISVEPSNREFQVRANELLFDVFTNILTNAVKYNDNPIVKVLVKIHRVLRKDSWFVRLEFIDNGIGISDNIKKIIFMNGKSEAKRSRGMGFGMSLVKKIIRSYNGKIWIEDNVEGDYSKGTNVNLLIPES